MSVWGAITWDTARAGGFVAYGLLTLSVLLGLALSTRWQSPRWPRFINSELHNFVTLLGLVFTIAHVLAVWLDPFTAFGWSEVFIPFVSHYRPLWMAFGVVALYLGLALAASVWLRPYIGYEWWRRLHVLTLVAYLLVTVHGLTTGSDTQTVWGAAIYAISALSVVTLLWIRLLVPSGPQQRRHPVWVGVTGLLLFFGVIAAALWPMRSGWASIANNGNGTGQRGSVAAALASQNATPTPTTNAATHTTLAAPFQVAIGGQMHETLPDANNNVRLSFTSTLRDSGSGATGVLTINLNGKADSNGDGQVSITSNDVRFGPSATQITYQGQLTSLDAERNPWRLEGILTPVSGSGAAIDLRVTLLLQDNGQFSGQAQATTIANPTSARNNNGV